MRLVLAFVAFAASAALSLTTHDERVGPSPVSAECVQHGGHTGSRPVAVEALAAPVGSPLSWQVRFAHAAAASVCDPGPDASQIGHTTLAGRSPATVPHFRRFPLLI